MSIEKRKIEESACLKGKILEAALRIFTEEGYDRVSMRKIASLIDYSATTIYRFFRNKEDLLRNIMANTYRILAARFEEVKERKGEDSLDTLKKLIWEYTAFCVEQPEMFRLFSDLARFELEDGIMYEVLGENRYMVYQTWFDYIRQSISSGSLACSDEMKVFLFLWDAVNGYIDHRIDYPRIRPAPLAEDAPAFIDLLFAGIATKKGTIDKEVFHE